MTQTAGKCTLSGSGEIPAQICAALINTSDDAIVVKSLDGMISTWNQGAMRMYGYSPDEVIGQPMTMLCPPERAGEIADILVKIRAGERISHYETVRQRMSSVPRQQEMPPSAATCATTARALTPST